MTQQLYSHHPYNDSMFMSSIYGSSGGLPYGSGAASDLLHPMTTAHQHQQQQQVFSNSQYPQSQLHHLGLADTGGWTFPPSSALDVQLGLKRPIQEDSLAASFLSKRAKVDNLVPQRIEPVASISLYPQRPGEKFCTFYMTTSLCKFGASCKFDHPTWVPAGGIPNWKENTVPTAEIPAESGVYPERPGEPDCAFYMKTGLCKYGGNCRFNHPKERPPVNPSEDHPIEGKTEQTKSAGLGADFLNLPAVTEKYDRTAPLNSKGLPLRPGQTDCAFYLKTGNCKYGDSCRFNHPENVAVADVKPAVFAMPQAQLPYSSFLTSIGVANEFGLVGGNYTLPLPGHPYPIRPGEPECTFYMKHGECKFGPNCKFNHPLNRFDPIYTKPVKLTAGGLPRREGEPPCPFYLKTGGCRFQENCKFDHPPPGEFAAKASLQPVKTDESP